MRDLSSEFWKIGRGSRGEVTGAGDDLNHHRGVAFKMFYTTKDSFMINYLRQMFKNRWPKLLKTRHLQVLLLNKRLRIRDKCNL